MRLEQVDEEKRARFMRIRAKMCTAATRRKGVREEVCAACESPCEYGRQMLALLGMEMPKKPARVADVFERVVHDYGSRTRKVVHSINKGRSN